MAFDISLYYAFLLQSGCHGVGDWQPESLNCERSLSESVLSGSLFMCFSYLLDLVLVSKRGGGLYTCCENKSWF